MNEIETARLVFEIAGLGGVGGMGLRWLGRKIAKGFKGVHDRLDTLNGKVAKHDRLIVYLYGQSGQPLPKEEED